MKQLIIGIAIGLSFSAYCFAKEHIIVNPMVSVPTDRNLIMTTKVSTDEGTYRVFTLESPNGAGITAIKIK